MEELKKNWIIASFVAAMILWYGNVNARLNSVEAKQAEQATLSEKINQLLTDVAVIKNDVSTIKGILK